jgi:hypothetical protein
MLAHPTELRGVLDRVLIALHKVLDKGVGETEAMGQAWYGIGVGVDKHLEGWKKRQNVKGVKGKMLFVSSREKLGYIGEKGPREKELITIRDLPLTPLTVLTPFLALLADYEQTRTMPQFVSSSSAFLLGTQFGKISVDGGHDDLRFVSMISYLNHPTTLDGLITHARVGRIQLIHPNKLVRVLPSTPMWRERSGTRWNGDLIDDRRVFYVWKTKASTREIADTKYWTVVDTDGSHHWETAHRCFGENGQVCAGQ